MNRCVNYAISINTESEKSGNSDANLVPIPDAISICHWSQCGWADHPSYSLSCAIYWQFVRLCRRMDTISSLYGLFGIAVRLNAAVIASLAHFPGSIGHAMINRRTMLQAREFRSWTWLQQPAPLWWQRKLFHTSDLRVNFSKNVKLSGKLRRNSFLLRSSR